MKFDVKKHPELPVVIGTWLEGFKFAENGDEYAAAANALLDEQSEPVFYIIDLSDLETITVDGITEVANRGAKNLKSSYRHPMNREMILISNTNIIKMAVKGARTAAFGNLKINLFEKLAEAITYIEKNT